VCNLACHVEDDGSVRFVTELAISVKYRTELAKIGMRGATA